MASKGIKALILVFVSKTGQLVTHNRDLIYSSWHFTGLIMLRERPFDIYTGQEDVFGPGYFFHDAILSFYFYVIRYAYCPKIIQSLQ